VTPWAPAGDPLAHVAVRERELAHGNPPLSGYRLVRFASVPYYQGAADWEFQFDGGIRGRMHGVVRDFVVAPGRGYTITWCTTDFDWTLNLDNYRLVMASFAAPK
jgi:hypothetical protein